MLWYLHGSYMEVLNVHESRLLLHCISFTRHHTLPTYAYLKLLLYISLVLIMERLQSIPSDVENREIYSEIFVWKHLNINTNPLQKQQSKYILWIIQSNTVLYSDNRSMIRFPIQKTSQSGNMNVKRISDTRTCCDGPSSKLYFQYLWWHVMLPQDYLWARLKAIMWLSAA